MKQSTLLIIIASVLLVMAVVFTTARGSKNKVVGSSKYITQRVDITDFNAIKVIGSIDVKYTPSSDVSASVRCPDNLLEYLNIRVSGKTLIVAFRDGSNVRLKGRGVNLTVSSPYIESAVVVGSGDIEINGPLTSQTDVVLRVTGSGDIKCQNITCPKITMEVTGSGDMECYKIDSREVTAKVAGSGDLECKSVAAVNTHITLGGSGDIDFGSVVCEDITATLSGSGDIRLNGVANRANYSVAGSGDMSADGLEAKAVTAKVRGSGTIRCYATQTLATAISGSGSILYKGSPELTLPGKGVRKL